MKTMTKIKKFIAYLATCNSLDRRLLKPPETQSPLFDGDNHHLTGETLEQYMTKTMTAIAYHIKKEQPDIVGKSMVVPVMLVAEHLKRTEAGIYQIAFLLTESGEVFYQFNDDFEYFCFKERSMSLVN